MRKQATDWPIEKRREQVTFSNGSILLSEINPVYKSGYPTDAIQVLQGKYYWITGLFKKPRFEDVK
jgi:hypothetical protein